MTFQLATIIIEALICLISLYAGLRGRKSLFGFAIAFGIYLYYDLVRFYNWPLPTAGGVIVPAALFLASVSALYSVWKTYKFF